MNFHQSNPILYVLLLTCFICNSPVFCQQDRYVDTAFLQDKSQFYEIGKQFEIQLKQVASDRNGNIQVLSNTGILHPYEDRLTSNRHYRFINDLTIVAMDNYQDQFIYLTDQSIFSNAWAGKVLINHQLPTAALLAGGDQFEFLIGSQSDLHFYRQNELVWSDTIDIE